MNFGEHLQDKESGNFESSFHHEEGGWEEEQAK